MFFFQGRERPVAAPGFHGGMGVGSSGSWWRSAWYPYNLPKMASLNKSSQKNCGTRLREQKLTQPKKMKPQFSVDFKNQVLQDALGQLGPALDFECSTEIKQT